MCKKCQINRRQFVETIGVLTAATLLIFVIIISSACARRVESVMLPVGLTCGYVANPLGIDNTEPLLGWQFAPVYNAEQMAYRVMVAENEDGLRKNTGDMWDSGKVPSSKSQNVRYGGKPLRSGQYYYWKVQVWDNDGKISEWSNPAFWSMGILSEQEWEGQWISSRFAEVSPEKSYKSHWDNKPDYVAMDTAAVYLRKPFDAVDNIKRATAFICGLGYYELYINGGKIGDRVMDPVFTDYQKQVCYAAYDVTTSLKKGKNTVGVILGNGFYNQPAEDLFAMDDAPWKTPPKLLVNIVIEYKSGKKQVIVSDETWKWSTGEIVFNCIRGGETIDHTQSQKDWDIASFDDSGWQEVTVVSAPVGILKAQNMPPMKINESIRPVKITQPKEGIYLVDFGKNITGWVALTTQGKNGQIVKCDYNEALNSDGTLNVKYSTSHTKGRFQQEIFILDGNGEETFEPRFTYHGFRYVQLQGLTKPLQTGDVIAKSVHTALDTTGYFACSDERFNWLQAAVQRTALNSIHSMPAEEPTREKMGWTFDAGVLMETYLYNFDAITTYIKSMRDFMDGRDPRGHIASIVPTNGWVFFPEEGLAYECCYDPWWGGSIYTIVEHLYVHTGNTDIIAEAFDAMKEYVDFVATTTATLPTTYLHKLEGHATGAIGEEDFVYWQIGDWLDQFHGTRVTPVVQTSTAAYYWMNERLSCYARILGKDDISAQYAANAKRIRDRFNASFLNRKTGWYAENSQTAQALPLYLNMVPSDMIDKVEERLLDAIVANDGHISAGFIGSNPVLEYLSRNGHEELAFRMVAQRESPGWLQMVKGPNSTLGENLNAKGYGTGHHPYGAHIGFWLYKYLGGIRPTILNPGYKEFIIEPMFVPEMDYISVKTKSLYGEIVSSWKREGSQINLELVIPGNTQVTLLLPPYKQMEISVGKDAVTLPNNISHKGTKIGVDLKSGIYRIKIIN